MGTFHAASLLSPYTLLVSFITFTLETVLQPLLFTPIASLHMYRRSAHTIYAAQTTPCLIEHTAAAVVRQLSFSRS